MNQGGLFTQPEESVKGTFCLHIYFFLCLRGLMVDSKKSFATGDTKGFFLCKNGPQIFHIFFAADSLIVCRAQMRDVVTIQAILT